MPGTEPEAYQFFPTSLCGVLVFGSALPPSPALLLLPPPPPSAQTHTHNLLTHNLSLAGVALGDIDLHFAAQAWHLVTWTCTLRGLRGGHGTW